MANIDQDYIETMKLEIEKLNVKVNKLNKHLDQLEKLDQKFTRIEGFVQKVNLLEDRQLRLLKEMEGRIQGSDKSKALFEGMTLANPGPQLHLPGQNNIADIK